MDKEMIDFLDKKFTKIDEKFDRVDEKFDKIDEKFDKIDERFDKIDEKFEKVDEKLEDNKRYYGVIAESLRSDVKAVAEGHSQLQQQIESFREETREQFNRVERQIQHLQKEIVEIRKDIAGLRLEVEGIKKEIIELRRDNEKSLQEFIAAVKFSYSGLDQRVTVLETKLDSK